MFPSDNDPLNPSRGCINGFVMAAAVAVALAARADAQEPPARYLGSNWQSAEFTVTLHDGFRDLREACAEALPHVQAPRHVWACAKPDGDVCHIHMISPRRVSYSFIAVLRHEVAHCNGWPHWHPTEDRS